MFLDFLRKNLTNIKQSRGNNEHCPLREKQITIQFHWYSQLLLGHVGITIAHPGFINNNNIFNSKIGVDIQIPEGI